MTCTIAQWGQMLFRVVSLNSKKSTKFCVKTEKIKFITFLTVSVKFWSKNQMSSCKIPMRLQKDFDHTALNIMFFNMNFVQLK